MSKDYTKYEVSGIGEKLNKARLVQAIVKDYIAKNTPNWEALQTAFPNNLQGNKSVVAKKNDVEKERDFYMDAPFSLSDGTEIVTCRQWGKDNILNFIAQAKTLGYSVLVDGETAEEVEEESPLDAEQIEKFKAEETDIYADPDDYAEWNAFSLYDDLLEAGDTAWSDRTLQNIEDRADGASTFESICEKLQERKETERLFVAAKKGEALAEDTSDYTSLANIISKEDKNWALKLYEKAEELAEGFSDLNGIGDALFEELGDKENAVRVQRKAMSLIENEWDKKFFLSSLENLGRMGKSLLAEYIGKTDSNESESFSVTVKTKVEEVKETPIIKTQTMKEININISGRISNYIFGIVEPEYYAECEKALDYASEEVETMAEFMTMLYETTLENGFEPGLDVFKANMDMEQFAENCPLLMEFLNEVEAGDASYYQFYETVLDVSGEEVNIIEDDAAITITVDGEDVVPQQKLADFLDGIEWVDEDDDPKAVAMAKAFWAKNGAKFNLEDREEYRVNKAKNGVLQFDEWFEPERLKGYKTRERNITVEHDNIVDFDFFFETVDFDLSKLAFLQYGNAADFHRSAPEYVGSFLSYDNNVIRPDMNIHRDKGFTLYYEVGLKSCDFLIEG